MVVNEKNAKSLQKLISVVAIAGMALMVGVLLVATRYTVMIADDFWYAKMTGRFVNFWDYLKLSWGYMVYEYKYYQGTYFSEFICALFDPVSWGGFTLLRVIMFINCIVSFASILWMLFEIMEGLFAKRTYIKLVLLACFTFTLTQYDAFPEIFFWYVGAGVYSIPLSLAFFSIALLVRANRKESGHKKGMLIASGILGFLGVGGSLAISGMVTYLVLMIVAFYFLSGKRKEYSNHIIFVIYFLGSLFSAAAPGNFARQSVETSEKISLIKTFGDTCKVFYDILNFLFVNRNFVVIALVAIMCGITVAGELLVSKKAWYLLTVFLVFLPFIAIFPVVLGYNVPWIPNRCVYIALNAMALFWINLFFIIGTFIGERINSNGKAAVVIGLSIVSVIIVLAGDFSIRSYKSVRHIKNLYDGVYQSSYEDTKEILESLENLEGQDVVLDVTTDPNIIENYYSFYIPNETNTFINDAVAWKYNLSSVVSSREDGE